MSRFAMFPKGRRMMSCRRVGQALQGYLDGEIDDLTARRIARHLEDCRRCGMELEVYAEIKASLHKRGGDVDSDALARLRSFGQGLVSDAEAEPGAEEETPGA